MLFTYVSLDLKKVIMKKGEKWIFFSLPLPASNEHMLLAVLPRSKED
jgi:hypothetical protein